MTVHRSRNFCSLCGALTICVSQLASAQSDATAAIQQETARLQAQAARDQAETALMQAKVAPLSNFAGQGNYTLGAGAGSMESWILSGTAIAKGAEEIASAMPQGVQVVVLAGDEPFNMRLLGAFRLELSGVQDQLNQSLASVTGKCTVPAAKAAPILPMLSAVVSLLQSDTTLSGIVVSMQDRVLSDAVAHRLGGRAIIPAAIQVLPQASTLTANLATADKTAADALTAKSCLGLKTKVSDVDKAQIALLDAAVSRYQTFKTAMTAVDANGHAPLSDALIFEEIEAKNPIILRVYADQVGGTLETRKNLWTALGAAPASITGGLFASFEATDPSTGRPAAAGIVTCRTAKIVLAAVHAARVGANCDLVTR